MKRLTFALLLVVLACTVAHCDSAAYVIQDFGTQHRTLANSPTIGLSFDTHTPYLEFGGTLPAMAGTVTFSLTLLGVTQTAPFTVFFATSQDVIQGFWIPRNIYEVTPATLTISYGGQTDVFPFTVLEPVPEPGTLSLLGLGLLGVGRKLWRK